MLRAMSRCRISDRLSAASRARASASVRISQSENAVSAASTTDSIDAPMISREGRRRNALVARCKGMRRIVKILKTVASIVYRTPPSYAILSKTFSAMKTFAAIDFILSMQRLWPRVCSLLILG